MCKLLFLQYVLMCPWFNRVLFMINEWFTLKIKVWFISHYKLEEIICLENKRKLLYVLPSTTNLAKYWELKLRVPGKSSVMISVIRLQTAQEIFMCKLWSFKAWKTISLLCFILNVDLCSWTKNLNGEFFSLFSMCIIRQNKIHS